MIQGGVQECSAYCYEGRPVFGVMKRPDISIRIEQSTVGKKLQIFSVGCLIHYLMINQSTICAGRRGQVFQNYCKKLIRIGHSHTHLYLVGIKS